MERMNVRRSKDVEDINYNTELDSISKIKIPLSSPSGMKKNKEYRQHYKCGAVYLLLLAMIVIQIIFEIFIFRMNQREFTRIQGMVADTHLNDYRNKLQHVSETNNSWLQNSIVQVKKQLSTFNTSNYLKENNPQQKLLILEMEEKRPNVLKPELQQIKLKTNSMKKEPSACKIDIPEALSAINRTESEECKKKIEEFICSKKTRNFVKSLPRYCPLQGRNKGEYVGCYKDSFEERVLQSHYVQFQEDNSPEKCISLCLAAGKNYAGVEYTYECFCGNDLKNTLRLEESSCNMTCPDKHNICGGALALSVYHTGFGTMPQHSVPLSPEEHTDEKKLVKIAYILLLNGRGVRQVKQLLRMIYSPNNYYYIHVDGKEEYLYRELKPLEELFHNIVVPEDRPSTVWAGSNFLTLHFKIMSHLLKMKHWKWDYYINLSESHFPIRPPNEVVLYLTKYQGLNFLQAQMGNNPFEARSANKYAFFECNGYVFNIGERDMPLGIVLGSGSDWFVLHRNFVEYIDSSQDALITSLKSYYEFTPFAPESFFQTVIRNSVFCSTHAAHNLLFVNWRQPERGCRCSKEGLPIDWCGCSPVVLLHEDLQLLKKNMEMKETVNFFARKFDGVISQKIITEMELSITHARDKDSYGAVDETLYSYWLNDYSYLDKTRNLSDTRLTHYNSFIRRALQNISHNTTSDSCSLFFHILKEVNIFSHNDTLRGMVLRYDVYVSNTMNKRKLITVETFIQMKNHLKIYDNNTRPNYIQDIQVGLTFDLVNEIFRDYGSLIGPFDNINAAIFWVHKKENFTVVLVYINPLKMVAGSFKVDVKNTTRVSIHKPSLAFPMYPGVWHLQVLQNKHVIAQKAFIVTPLSHLHGIIVTDNEAKTINAGPNHAQRNDIQSSIGTNSSETGDLIHKHALTTGKELLDWIDRLTNVGFTVNSSCLAFSSSRLYVCRHLLNCKNTEWSSVRFDAKATFPSNFSKTFFF